MKRLPVLLVFAFASTFVGLQGQTSVIPNWTTLPLSDFKNMSVYQTLSDFEGKHYSANVYGRDLDGVVKWNPGDELPIGMPKIIASAKEAFRKQFPDFSQFKIVSANLVHLPAVDDWVFDIEFNGTDFAKVNAGSFEDKKIDVVVLLNGHTVTPTETAK